MSSKATGPSPGIQEIKEHYETLIEGMRESVQQISDRIRPLTDEIDVVVAPTTDQASDGK
jgi:hypothetical protein